MTDHDSIEYTIVIPMFNAAENIKELISALKKQTLKNFEVIIVDDGSEDDSEEIVQLQEADFSLRLLSQPNLGPAAARNAGARVARADTLVFLDSDCIPMEDFLEKLTGPLRDEWVAGVQGEYETKNRESLIARYVGYEIYYRHRRMIKREGIDHLGTYACAYRKADFGEGFLEEFRKADMEDIELSYRIAEKNRKLVFEPKARVMHTHPASLVKYLGQQLRRGHWRVLGHIKHPRKLIKDSYMGHEMMSQGSLSLLLLISLLPAVMRIDLPLIRSEIAPALVLSALYASNVPLGYYCARFERKMLLLAPLLASLRSIAGTIGFLHGVVRFRLLRAHHAGSC